MAICDASMTLADYLTNFEFIKAFSCTYFSSAGMLVTGLLVYGGVSLSIYIRTNSVIIPFVLLLLTGGVVMTQIANVGLTIATILLLTTGAIAVTMLYTKFSR